MKTRFLFAVLFLSLLSAAVSFASDQPALSAIDAFSATEASGPAPVPICPPEDGWCNTMPPKPTLVSGPAPVPICPPEDGWCNTMPPKPTLTSGPKN